MGRALLILMALVTLPSCGILSTDEDRVLAVIHPSDSRLMVPDAVSFGSTFEVSFYTFGDGCTRDGETEVEISEGSAVLTPYDYRERREVCNLPQNYLPHEASVRFDSPGLARVVLIGKDVFGVALEIEHPVWVR